MQDLAQVSRKCPVRGEIAHRVEKEKCAPYGTEMIDIVKEKEFIERYLY